MTDSERIRSLLDRMADHEKQIADIKVSLASLLGVVHDNGSAAPPPPVAPPPKTEEPRKKPDAAGRVAKGTKGRQVIELMDQLGGKARAGKVADLMKNVGPRKKAVKRVRTYIYHLSRDEAGYLEPGDEPGVWKLTPKAYEALGKEPPPQPQPQPQPVLEEQTQEGVSP